MKYLQPPRPDLVPKIQAKLETFGIRLEPDVVAVVVAAYEDWIRDGVAGKQHLVELCKFDWESGESDKEYWDPASGVKASGDQIYFMKAAIMKGEFIPPSQIDTVNIDRETCESCGGQTHCTKKVRDEKSNEKHICSHCLAMSDNTAWRGVADRCSTCSVERCQHNPMYRRVAGLRG